MTSYEQAQFEKWAKDKGHRFNEGDLCHCKSWAQAAWNARAILQAATRDSALDFETWFSEYNKQRTGRPATIRPSMDDAYAAGIARAINELETMSGDNAQYFANCLRERLGIIKL